MSPFSSDADPRSLDRRRFLHGAGLGFGGIALQSMLTQDSFGAGRSLRIDGRSQFAPKAKNVIWLFMRGGVSHMESFDPKPMLTRHAGQSISDSQFAHVQDPEKLKRVRVV